MKIIFIFIITTITLIATPFTPINKNEVLVALPKKTTKIKFLKEALNKDKTNEVKVDTLVSFYLQQGREQSDPRYFGYAQAVLKPYLKNKDVSYSLKMHHIDILQHQHHFSEALKRLDEVKTKGLKDPKPYLMSAVILSSQGFYTEAMKECTQLIFRSSHLVSTTCITQMQSHNGKLEASYTLLKKTYLKSKVNEKEERLWSLSVLAKMALRTKQNEEAIFYMQEALSLDTKDYYILGMYADLLLKDKEYIKVHNLLRNYEYVDALLVRLSISQKELGLKESKHNISKLRSHYKNLELRGEKAHLREQAQFELYLEGNNKKAWAFALENIQMQKEQSDIDIYKKAAIAMNINEKDLKIDFKGNHQ